MPVATAIRKPVTARVPIDIAVADDLRVRLELVAVADPHTPHISGLIIDMTHKYIVDSAGLLALQAVRDHAGELGIALCVAGPGESVRRLLYLADIISPRSGVNPGSEPSARLPVASDLRILVTSLRMSADLERMGDLARHIAKVSRMRYPQCAIPEMSRETIPRMGRSGRSSRGRSGGSSRTRTSTPPVRCEAQDDAVDRLHRAVFTELLSPENPYAIETAIDVTLLSRYYERFADHAVSVAHRLVFLVTGEQDGQQ